MSSFWPERRIVVTGGRGFLGSYVGEVRTRRRSLLFSSNPAPGPGSEVLVPFKDPNAPHTDTVALVGAIAQILASTVAIIVVARRF